MEGTLRGSIADVLEGQISGSLELLAGEPVLENLSVSSNGVYEPRTGVDGFDKVTVNVPTEEPELETLNVTQNGTYTPGSGVDGFDEVNVNVPSDEPVLDSIEINENGHYTPPAGTDGYDDITVYVPYVSQGKTIIENGTYTPPSGVDGFDQVIVDVPTPPPSLQSLTVSHNGYFLPSSGYDGFDEVTVDVATPLETLSATENGTYTPSSGYEGFSEVTVDVPLPNNAYLLESQKDDVVTIQNGAEFDMPKLIVSIEPQQSGSGDPSPENVRPISGWTACNVVRTGKNLAYSQTNNTVVAHAKKGVTYTLSFDGTNKGANVKKNTSTGDKVATGTNPLTFTADEDFDVFLNAWNSEFTNLQVEVGSSATTYEEYNGNTYTINFVDGSSPLTVYGGTLDVLSGVLTVNRGQYTIDENQQNITIQSSESYGTVFRIVTRQSCIQNNTQISNQFKFDNNAWQINSNRIGTFVLGSEGNLYVQAPPSVGTTVDAFRTWLTSHNIQINYELATPQTYQLTPTEVKSLLGVNSIYADTGEVDVQVWTKDI